MAYKSTVVLYYRKSNVVYFYVPSPRALVRSTDSRQWVEAQGYTIVNLSSFLAKSQTLVDLCEIEDPGVKSKDWVQRVNVVHSSVYSDEVSLLIQIAHDRITGNGPKR